MKNNLLATFFQIQTGDVQSPKMDEDNADWNDWLCRQHGLVVDEADEDE